MKSKRWTVEIVIGEDSEDRETYAEARLHTGDRTHLTGTGRARRNPTDREVPEIGDELATARALAELAHALLNAAADDIEGVTREHVQSRS